MEEPAPTPPDPLIPANPSHCLAPAPAKKTMPTLICDCNQTMPLQPQALGGALNENLTLHSALCRREVGAFQKAVQSGDDVVVAWYTAAAGEPELRLALSGDDGVTFAAPRVVARGPEVQGRVDLAIDDRAVYVAWIDEDSEAQTLRLAQFTPDLSRELARVDVATLARGRGTGFPRMALRDGAVYLAWTDVVERVPRVRAARVDFDAAK